MSANAVKARAEPETAEDLSDRRLKLPWLPPTLAAAAERALQFEHNRRLVTVCPLGGRPFRRTDQKPGARLSDFLVA